MNKFTNKIFGCLFGIFIMPCIGTIIAITLIYQKEIFNFIKHHIPLTVNIIAIILLIVLSVKLYLSEKNFSEHLKNENKYDYYKYELESYKKTHPAWMPKEIDTLKKEIKKLKNYPPEQKKIAELKKENIEIKSQNYRLRIENESLTEQINNIDEKYKTGIFDEFIHLYKVSAYYKHADGTEGPHGAADIDIVYRNGANFDGQAVHQLKESNPEICIKALYFYRNKNQRVKFNQQDALPGVIVQNKLILNQYTEVVTQEGKKQQVYINSKTLENHAYRIHEINLKGAF